LNTGGLHAIRGVVDSKAMRIIRPDQEVSMIIQTTGVVGAPVVDAAGIFRFLFAD